MIRLRGAAVLAAGWWVVAGAPAAPAAAAAPPYVAIVISGHGTGCVHWHPGITGDEVLNDIASVHYRSDGIIDQIDGTPSPPHADDTHYWSYWHNTGSGWTYSSTGANSWSPPAGSVEGWSFVDGQQHASPPAAVAFSQICRAAAPAPSSTVPRTTRSAAPPASAPVHHVASVHSSVRTAAPHASSSPARSASGTAVVAAAKRHRAVATPKSRSASDVPSSYGVDAASAGSRPAAPGSSSAASAAHPTRPTDLIVGALLVAALGAGGVWATIRRRRSPRGA